MRSRQRFILLIFLLLLTPQSKPESTVAANVTTVALPGLLKSQHKLAQFWPLLSSIGVVGTILNSYVLYCFISERNNMVTSVNVMIGMDTTYRLIDSVVLHWRSYLMSSDVNLFSSWIDMEMECFLMTVVNLIPRVASIVYSASTSLIRFLYVRSSLQENIQEVYTRNQFTLLFVAIGEGINILNIISAVGYRRSEFGFPLILYKACLDPWDVFSVPFYEVMPLTQGITYFCDFLIISSNLFLYRFLRKNTQNNTALNATDRVKARKRNFVPANVGIYSTVVCFSATTQYFFFFQSKGYDNGTRAFILNSQIDIFYCILCPGVVFYGAPTIRRKFTKVFSGIIPRTRWNRRKVTPTNLILVQPRQQGEQRENGEHVEHQEHREHEVHVAS